MTSDAVVQTNDLHKRFGPIHAVDGVTLSVRRGEIYGLLGPNGSGKTTLIRLLLGLLRPTSGSIRLLGSVMPNKAILGQVGYMTQSSALYEELSVRENVAFFAERCGRKDRVDNLAAQVVADLLDRDPWVVLGRDDHSDDP